MTSEFDKKNAAQSRKVCVDMAEAASTGKRVLTGREYRILDMWPRFDDGAPVMVGDGAVDGDGERFTVLHIEAAHRRWVLKGPGGQGNRLVVKPRERVKRPAPKVLDADGVEIKVGDTVWHEDGSELCITGFGDVQDGETILYVEYLAGATEWFEVRSLSVTHTRPDSWERLEEDAADLDDMPCDFSAKDLIRRAKALAGIEVVE